MIDKTIAQARTLLTVAPSQDNLSGTLAAALLAAVAAVLMAGVLVLGPGVRFNETIAVGSIDR